MQLTSAKKIALIIIVSIVGVLAIIGAAYPEARPYITQAVQMLLGAVPGLAQ